MRSASRTGRDPSTRAGTPLHVTLRAERSLPSLRCGNVFPCLRAAIGRSRDRGFRILQFSVQRDHLHLICEADARDALSRGLQGLGIRLAKAVNRALGRRGRVWADRYHARALRTPREVRYALVYVLQNVKKHLRGARGVDPCSSAAAFTGWRRAPHVTHAIPSVSPPQTWLAAVGWKRHGLLDPDEAPGPPAGRTK